MLDELRVGDDCMLRWEVLKFDGGTFCSIIFVKSGVWKETWNSHSVILDLSAHLGSVLTARYFYLPSGADLGEPCLLSVMCYPHLTRFHHSEHGQ